MLDVLIKYYLDRDLMTVEEFKRLYILIISKIKCIKIEEIVK
ncbi:hypothetical protein ['Camptotheca acuminata' phytoplasma]